MSSMQITDNAIINGLWGVLVVVVGFLARLVWKIMAKSLSRIKDLEDKVLIAITKPEVDIIVSDVKREFKSDHKGLESKMERIEDSLRTQIMETHDSLQNGIDRVVNILLTRDENDRRRRDD